MTVALPGAFAQPAEAVATRESVDNPYGLDALWKGGDIVAKTTLGILVIMSIGSWYIVFTKLDQQAVAWQIRQGGQRQFLDCRRFGPGR